MKSNNTERQTGFTLIEAIVALVIMSSALTGLYTWINTGLISLQRAESVTITSGIVQEAVQQISLLPLLSQDRGQFPLSRYQVSWRAARVEPLSASHTLTGSVGLYDLSLFNVDFSVSLGSSELGQWSVRQLRHEKSREPDGD